MTGVMMALAGEATIVAPPPPPPDTSTTITVSPGDRFAVGRSAAFNLGNFAFNATSPGFGPNAFTYRIYRESGSAKVSMSNTFIPVAGNRNVEGQVSGLAVGEDATSTWIVEASIPGVGRSGSERFSAGGYRAS